MTNQPDPAPTPADDEAARLARIAAQIAAISATPEETP